MIPQVTAAALVSENKQRAYPGERRFDPHLGQPGGPRLDGGPRRAPALTPMADNAAAVIGIELLAAAQGCDFHAPLASSPPLEAVRALLRREVPHLDEDRYLHPDMEAAQPLVARRRKSSRAAGARAFARRMDARRAPETLRPSRRSNREGATAAERSDHDPHRQRPHHPRAARHRALAPRAG